MLPLTIAGRKPDREWLDALIARSASTTAARTARASSPAASSSASPSPARSCTRPAVVFADEPTGNLDSQVLGRRAALLRRAVDEFGQTVVMVTHDPDAAAIADRIVELADGRIVRRGRVAAAA